MGRIVLFRRWGVCVGECLEAVLVLSGVLVEVALFLRGGVCVCVCFEAMVV